MKTINKYKNLFCTVLSSLCVCSSMGVCAGLPISSVELEKNVTELIPDAPASEVLSLT